MEKNMKNFSEWSENDKKAYRLYLTDASDGNDDNNAIEDVLLKTLSEKDFITLRDKNELYTAVVEDDVAKFSKVPAGASYDKNQTYFKSISTDNTKYAVVTSRSNRFINIPVGGKFIEKDIEVEKIPRAIFSNNGGLYTCFKGGYIPTGQVVMGLGQTNNPSITPPEIVFPTENATVSEDLNVYTYLSKSSEYQNDKDFKGLKLRKAIYAKPILKIVDISETKDIDIYVENSGYFSKGKVDAATGSAHLNLFHEYYTNIKKADIRGNNFTENIGEVTISDETDEIPASTVTSTVVEEGSKTESSSIEASVSIEADDIFVSSGTSAFEIKIKPVINSISHNFSQTVKSTATATDGIIESNILKNTTDTASITISSNLTNIADKDKTLNETKKYLKVSSYMNDDKTITAEDKYLSPGSSLLIKPGFYSAYRRIISDVSGNPTDVDKLESLSFKSYETLSGTIDGSKISISNKIVTIPVTFTVGESTISANDKGWLNKDETTTLNSFSLSTNITMDEATCSVSGGELSGPDTTITQNLIISPLNDTNMDTNVCTLANLTNGSDFKYHFAFKGEADGGTGTVNRASISLECTEGYHKGLTKTVKIQSDSKTVTVGKAENTEAVVLKESQLTTNKPTISTTKNGVVQTHVGGSLDFITSLTTEQPSGTVGTDYIALGAYGSVTTKPTVTAKYTYSATAGYRPAVGITEVSSDGATEITPTVNASDNVYLPRQKPEFTGGVSGGGSLEFSSSGVTYDKTTKNGISITTTRKPVTRSAIKYKAINGWVRQFAIDEAIGKDDNFLAEDSSTIYITNINVPDSTTLKINGGGTSGIEITGKNVKIKGTTVTSDSDLKTVSSINTSGGTFSGGEPTLSTSNISVSNTDSSGLKLTINREDVELSAIKFNGAHTGWIDKANGTEILQKSTYSKPIAMDRYITDITIGNSKTLNSLNGPFGSSTTIGKITDVIGNLEITNLGDPNSGSAATINIKNFGSVADEGAFATMNISRFEQGKINILNDAVELECYYDDGDPVKNLKINGTAVAHINTNKEVKLHTASISTDIKQNTYQDYIIRSKEVDISADNSVTSSGWIESISSPSKTFTVIDAEFNQMLVDTASGKIESEILTPGWIGNNYTGNLTMARGLYLDVDTEKNLKIRSNTSGWVYVSSTLGVDLNNETSSIIKKFEYDSSYSDGTFTPTDIHFYQDRSDIGYKYLSYIPEKIAWWSSMTGFQGIKITSDPFTSVDLISSEWTLMNKNASKGEVFLRATSDVGCYDALLIYRFSGNLTKICELHITFIDPDTGWVD